MTSKFPLEIYWNKDKQKFAASSPQFPYEEPFECSCIAGAAVGMQNRLKKKYDVQPITSEDIVGLPTIRKYKMIINFLMDRLRVIANRKRWFMSQDKETAEVTLLTAETFLEGDD